MQKAVDGWGASPNSNLVVRDLNISLFGGRTEMAVQSAAPLGQREYYFELTVLALPAPVADKVIAVGIAPKYFPPNRQLPGWLPSTFGYHSDDGLVFAGPESGDGQLFEPFGVGDTVGCGIMVDGRVFFTRNGALLGMIEQPLAPRLGTPYYATVGLQGAGIRLTSNFGRTPFAFDPTSLPLGRPFEVAQPDQRLFISDLPSEVLVKIFKHAGTKPRDVVRLGEVSNAWRQLSQENEIWRDLFFQRWATQNKKLKIKTWGTFYKRRHEAMHAFGLSERVNMQKEAHAIENCEWEFKCPLVWESLQPNLADPKDRYKMETRRMCQVCNEHVYYVTNTREMNEHVASGHCVCLDTTPRQEPARERTRMMGRRCF